MTPSKCPKCGFYHIDELLNSWLKNREERKYVFKNKLEVKYKINHKMYEPRRIPKH